MRTPGGISRTIALFKSPWDVGAVENVGGTEVLIDQKLNYDTHDLIVIGSGDGLVENRFMAYDPALSPDHEKLAFVSWYAEHFTDEENSSDFVVMYDFRRSPSENRHGYRTDFSSQDVPDRRIGFQIFPQHRHPVPGDGGQAVRPTFGLMSEFYWSPDSTKLVFLDSQFPSPRFAGSGETYGNIGRDAALPARSGLWMVLSDVSNPLPITKAVPVPICPNSVGEDCGVRMTSLSFDRLGLGFTYQLTFDNGLAPVTRTMAYTDFKRTE